MTRLPILALSLAALAGPALAQDVVPRPAEDQPAIESQEARPTNQTSQNTTEGLTEQHVEADQPEDAMPFSEETQGGTGGLFAGDGTFLGNVSVSATASGYTIVLIDAEGFREGIYGVHLHQFGVCEGPDFLSAGEHIGGLDEHGVYTDTGPHPGDLPNAHVGSDQEMNMEAFAIGLTMEMLFDEDGTSLVVTADPDDYTTQPSGNSGEYIACAVIEAAPATLTDETVDAGEVMPADEPVLEDAAEQEAILEE